MCPETISSDPLSMHKIVGVLILNHWNGKGVCVL